MKLEIVIAGFGGQGIIKAGLIVGSAASLFTGLNACFARSYGPEARGGACKAEVIISDEEIDYPKIENPDVLVAMSQEGYEKYVEKVKEKGLIILDPDLVEPFKPGRVYKVPATRIAEKLGKKIVANVVMIGVLTLLIKVLKPEDVENSLVRNVPPGTEKLNLKAFREGYEYGKNFIKETERTGKKN